MILLFKGIDHHAGRTGENMAVGRAERIVDGNIGSLAVEDADAGNEIGPQFVGNEIDSHS